MLAMNGYTATPNHRSNRRRERPGSRTRRTINRKAQIQSEFKEGLLDALDTSVQLPSDKTRPSPLVRQTWDQSWQRWQTRMAEERALAERDRLKLEMEQQRLLFGDFVDDDDELYRLGILYNEDSDTIEATETNAVCWDAPLVEQQPPAFILRQGKPRRSRRPAWQSIPLLLSLSNLRDDSDIARLLSPQPPTPTIQHREAPPTPSSPTRAPDPPTDPPQSLPTASVLASPLAHGSPVSPLESPQTVRPRSFPQHGDWTFIDDTAPHTPTLHTPASEPETWILLSDDS